jgi:alginate production protein
MAADDAGRRLRPAGAPRRRTAPRRRAVPVPAAAAPAAPGAGVAPLFGARPARAPTALFQLPPAAERIGRPPRPVTQFLTYQYSFGSESDVDYRRDRDLDRHLWDNATTAAPQVNGYVLYRPNDQLEMMLEMVLERELSIDEQRTVRLPDGELQAAEHRRASLSVDQMWVKLRPNSHLELTLGRRNYEDERHWLYDASLDVVMARFRQGSFNAELSYGRKDAVNLDVLKPVTESRTDNFMAYFEYRGIEDIKVAAYSILQDDRRDSDGRPLLSGMRASGMPTDRLNFWSERAILRGKDGADKRFSGHAIDAGATYRFPDLPLAPGVTLGYATASGDANPNDNRNREFRQTGLHSNELKMAGVSKFKYYGEALDPDLSNLQILTVGLGFRPATTVHVDLVYHKYRTKEYAEEIRNWALTARMNQDPTRRPSNDVGSGFDVVVGFRNLFGVRRLGLDVRAGWFFPGDAFRAEVPGDPDNPRHRPADKGISVLAKFWLSFRNFTFAKEACNEYATTDPSSPPRALPCRRHIRARRGTPPAWQQEFGIKNCSLQTTGRNPYFILEPPPARSGRGNTKVQITVLDDTRKVDGYSPGSSRERMERRATVRNRQEFRHLRTNQGRLLFRGRSGFLQERQGESHDGSWLAGTGGNKPGLIMPGTPKLNMKYYQEIAPNVAMDRAEIVSLNDTCKTPAGTFSNCLKVKEGSALELAVVEYKYFAPSIGLVQDEDLRLVRHGFIRTSTPSADPRRQ